TAIAEDEAKEIAAFSGRSKSRMVVAVLVAMVALVAFAFAMALLSQRR
ncbi:MAG: hypothetical protein K0S65_3377, partial [Labilithrix sp.]|nr:hypothetical protein [Labilithrix sp.]